MISSNFWTKVLDIIMGFLREELQYNWQHDNTTDPITGSVYGLVKTSIRVYEASTPVNTACEAFSGVLLDCSPPIVKYPLLCAYLMALEDIRVSTGGNSLAIFDTLNVVQLIIEEA